MPTLQNSDFKFRNSLFKVLKFTVIALLLCWGQARIQTPTLPEGFVFLQEAIPSIFMEARYFSGNNFTGRPVKGYGSSRLVLTKEAASALLDVQLELREKGLGLKVFDAYRPQRAVDDFVAWAQEAGDTAQKSEYYPNIPKNQLFEKGYIAAHSGHSRGSTVDVTLVNLQTGEELDMGTPFDFFGPRSAPGSDAVTPAQKENRRLLQHTMRRNGFGPLATEWWHFTLRGEPYPERYFDFVVE